MKKTIILGVMLLVGGWIYWSIEEWRSGMEALSELVVSDSDDETDSRARILRREAAVSFPTSARVQVPGPRDTSAPSPSMPVNVPPTAAAFVTPKEAAERYLAENRARLGIQDYHELRPTVYESPLGATVKYDVYQDGVPVLGMHLSLELSQDRQVSSVDSQYQPVPKVDMSQPFLSSEEIVQRQAGRFRLDEVSALGVSKVLYVVPGSDEPEMAYVIPVTDTAGKRSEQLLFRATDGQVLGRHVPRAEF